MVRVFALILTCLAFVSCQNPKTVKSRRGVSSKTAKPAVKLNTIEDAWLVLSDPESDEELREAGYVRLRHQKMSRKKKVKLLQDIARGEKVDMRFRLRAAKDLSEEGEGRKSLILLKEFLAMESLEPALRMDAEEFVKFLTATLEKK